jgi:hypothetical protein
MRTLLAAPAGPGGAAGMQSVIFLILIVLIIVIVNVRISRNRRNRNSMILSDSINDSKEQQNGLKCPACKKVIRSTDKFCQSCGEKL